MLEITDLSKRYGSVVALDGATFTVRPGRLVGFLGPERRRQDHDDALHLRAGPAGPRARSPGSGQPIDRRHRLRFGYMPEQRGLYPRMKVADQLSYFAQQHGLPARRRQGRDGALARRARASPTAPARSSRRCRTATSSASSSARRSSTTRSCSSSTSRSAASIRSASRRCRRSSASAPRPASAVVFSSHQLDLVEDVCEDVVIINRGRIAAAGAIDELRAASTRRHLEVEVVGQRQRLARRPAGPDRRRSGAATSPGCSSRPTSTSAAVLAAASAAGPVRRFAFQPPTLSELFLEVVRS